MFEVFGFSYLVWLPLGIFLTLYLYLTRSFGYWKDMGIPEVPPIPLIGSMGLDFKINQGKQEQQWYQKYGRIFGIYEGSTPVLMIAEPELLKDILLKDFYIFSEQKQFNFGDPILDKQLYAQNGKRWKELRNIMRPAFTTARVRSMVKLIDECSETLVKNLIDESKENNEVDIYGCLNAFVLDVIARCAFGIKLNSRKDPKNSFVKAVNQLINPTTWRHFVGNLFPGINNFINLSFCKPSVIQYFRKVIIDEINTRNKLQDETKPCDFLQIFIDAKENLDETNNGQKLELDDIIAQCMSFFISGYYTTSATMAFAIHQFAVKANLQERLIKEQELVLNNNGEIDCDTILNEMKYLEAVIHETLRYYSPAIRLERVTTEDYELGQTGVTIPKGTLVAAPIYAINHDSKYFQRPDKYNPDRFFGENRKNIQPFTYMPFGAGPRNCLGMKFAFMEIKIALAKILHYVKFKPGNNTNPIIEFVPGRGLNRPKEVILKVEVRKENCKDL